MNKTNDGKIIPWVCIVPIVATLALAACGGGGGGSSSSSTAATSPDGEALSLNISAARSLEVPTEISAIPTSDSSSNAPSAPRSFRSAIRSAARAATAAGLPADSDYHLIKKKTYVEERTLEVFDIIETVLSALGQTNYQDEVNNGPYKAVVAWEDNEGGRDVKQLQEWIVDSRLIVAEKPDGTTGDVLRALAWIEETDEFDGSTEVIKAEFRIYTGPTEDQNNPGAYVNFGSWDLNVYFDADPNAVDTTDPRDFFVAEARITDAGSTLKINNHETFEFGGVSGGSPTELNWEVKAILAREGLAGFGQVSFPDEEACWDQQSGVNCGTAGIPTKIAKYAYNANYLGVQDPNDATSIAYKFRDLSNSTPMVQRYGLFHKNADATVGIAEGDNALRHKSFGFPVAYDAPISGSSDTFKAWGYYGAWQGRHELWGPEEGVVVLNADGTNTGTATEFTKQDFSSETSNPPTYYLREFSGTLSKRGLVDASPNDVKGVPVETWLNKNYELFWTGANWGSCKDAYFDRAQFEQDGATQCRKFLDAAVVSFAPVDASLFEKMVVAENDRKWVSIGGWDNSANQSKDYVYLPQASSLNGQTGWSGAGFYEAQMDMQTGRKSAVTPLFPINSSNVNNLWVDISGSIYIKYVGFTLGDTDVDKTTTGWVKMPLTAFDEESWQPTFGTATSFTPDRDAEYYLNANGVNYVVKRTTTTTNDVNDYDVKLELQTAAHPGNTESSQSLTIMPSGTSYLAEPWNQQAKYKLVEDPTKSDYLTLVYVTDDPNTAADESAIVTVLSDDKWGLQAFNVSGQALAADGTPLVKGTDLDEFGFPTGITRPVEFNWEYAGQGESWGKQRFLVSTSDTSAYKILDNPISLNNVAVVDANGAAAGTVSVQYDGWMQGMPNLYFELSRNNWQMSDDIRNKVVIIQDGTEVSDGTTSYFVRPLETSIFLQVLSSTDVGIAETAGVLPNLEQANSPTVDVNGTDNLPTYNAHNMDGTPTADWDGNVLVTRYSEGKPIN